MKPSGDPAPVSSRPTTDRLRQRAHAQVLIIGGGINGVGTFRDLALQGIDVALVERADYCQGASGASSHMIHGGIRYLENGELRLVQEAVHERNGLIKIAPHYVKPLMTTIPIFTTFSGMLAVPLRFVTHKKQGKPKERGAILIKVGLTLYDWFSRAGGIVPRHEFKGRTKSLEELPDLNPSVKYTATYFDGSVHNPERLTLDLLKEAQAMNSKARAGNYLAVEGIDETGLRLRDQLTGEQFAFTADLVVNATGAWVDQTDQVLGSPSRFMGGTKGSHIVLDNPELLRACHGRQLFFEHTDGRIVLIYPMLDRVLVGTTDIDADISDEIVCTDEEIAYFFDLVKHIFPSIPVTRDQIVYTFSGVRPLPRHDETQPGFVSRDYRIEHKDLVLAGKTIQLLSLVGGKFTTFRALSEHMTNDVLKVLGHKRTVSTVDLPIGGGKGFPLTDIDTQAWIRQHTAEGVDEARVEVLLTRYGTRAAEVIDYLKAGEDHLLRSTPELSLREIDYMVEHEQIGHLVDVLIRRTSLAFRGLVTSDLLKELGDALSGPLGWDKARVAQEITDAEDVMRRLHRVQVPSHKPARAQRPVPGSTAASTAGPHMSAAGSKT
jgi:glycerol-3-phosphate dehydrogenase